MKTIIGYCRLYFRTEFHPGLFLTIALFLAGAIWGNYHFQIRRGWINSFQGEPVQILLFLGFYAVPYLVALLAWVFFRGAKERLKQRGYWAWLAFGLLLLSVNSWFHYHRDLALVLFDPPAQAWGTRLLWNMKSSVMYLVPLFLFWRLFDRDQVPSLYGLTRTNFSARPYLLMLLIVLPLIVWASSRPDFMASYPRYRPGPMEAALGWNPWVTTLLLQFFYGLDFTFVELFFRGFLVIGMVRWLGPGAILPMVTTYCFLHFGKPMGEAIASVFGGLLLGIFALYSRSILGGVIVHWGLAWMMEIAAYAHVYLAE